MLTNLELAYLVRPIKSPTVTIFCSVYDAHSFLFAHSNKLMSFFNFSTNLILKYPKLRSASPPYLYPSHPTGQVVFAYINTTRPNQ